jgi:hypothetical protein
MELIKDNYLRSSGSGNSWHVEIDNPYRSVKSYFKESIATAEYVYENKTGHMHLLYSGGVDSQYIFCLFLKLGFNFTPVIIRLNGRDGIVYNIHDIKFAFDYCTERNVKPVVFDIDFDKFVDSGRIIDIAELAECSVYSLPATMYAFGEIDGFVVSGNEPSLKYISENGTWALDETEYIHSILKYFRKKKLNGCPFMLSYSSEMLFSFLLDPTIAALANNQFPGKLGSNSSKSHVYNNGSGFNLPVYDFVSMDRIKYTGYETIKGSPIANHPNMREFENFRKKWHGKHLIDYRSLTEGMYEST